MATGPLEIEIKLALPDPATARRLLESAGLVESRPRTFEANQLWDTLADTLRATRQLLRTREFAGESILTYKGPPQEGRHKSREEVELTVSDAAALGAILARLGYRPTGRYEKYRTEFRHPAHAGLATLDETPCGTYIELEGPPEWIDATAQRMGFTPAGYILESYLRLWDEYAARNGLDPSAGMVFQKRKGRGGAAPNEGGTRIVRAPERVRFARVPQK